MDILLNKILDRIAEKIKKERKKRLRNCNKTIQKLNSLEKEIKTYFREFVRIEIICYYFSIIVGITFGMPKTTLYLDSLQPTKHSSNLTSYVLKLKRDIY